MKAEKILVVDDDEAVREVIEEILKVQGGYDVDTAVDGLDALEKIAQNEYGAIISDIRMPNLDGIGLLQQLRELDEDVSVIMVTVLNDLNTVRKTLSSNIYDYIPKPFFDAYQIIIDVADKAVERTKFLRQLKAHRKQEQMMLGSIMALGKALEEKDRYTAGHSERVAYWAEKIAREMKSSEAHPLQIEKAGRLHDLGKIGVPDAILLKDRELSPEEYEKVKKHPLVAVRILKDVILEKQILEGIRHHHERYDGSGYPYGLPAQSIPLTGRILACADCYDAITSTRQYRNAMTKKEAIKEIKRVAGTQLDQNVVDVFLSLITKDQNNLDMSA